MNKYDEKYDIRLANRGDIQSIMQFINEYWCEGHIMAKDRILFEYEYVDKDNVNFVLAIDKETKCIEGIFGFINTSYTEEYDKKYIWGSMWKVNDKHDNIPLLGIELARRVHDLTHCKRHIGNGANSNTTIPLRRLFFGEKVAKMKQYYYLNTSMSEYKIAKIEKQEIFGVPKVEKNKYVIKFNSMEEVKKEFKVEAVDAIPYKDSWYVEKRFFKHPYYKYNVYGIREEDYKVGALLVTRHVEYGGSKVIRIMDYIGKQELFSKISSTLYQEMIEGNYEYIDMYTLGFKEEYILEAGFKLKDDQDINIIPNYFEPFLRENVDIWCHYKDEETLFFKADGDQDRPNQLRNNN
ncbi:MAG: hypothetical protein E7231_13060 [Cellulosilyticum sp.]|nr:hypothetical protein [Cellulosilyticum sp.]